MKPETLKNLINKLTWAELNATLPMSQGLLLQEIILRYKIPAKQIGYNNGSDIVAVKTNKQILVWKDTGVGARFLGIMDRATKEISIKEDDEEKQNIRPFDNPQQLYAEIKKRDYNKILGLKAICSEEEYMDALEVMPPFKYVDNGFIQREALSEGTYLQFKKYKYTGATVYECEVVRLEDEEIMELER